MKKLTAFILFIFAANLPVFAQTKLRPKPVVVEFEENPMVHPVPPGYANEPAIILQNDVTMDYRFEGRGTNVYYTLHRVVKVLDELGIESFNTIGIPVSRYTRVPLIKVRTILPNGKVREMAKDMIKVTADEDGSNKIVIALEGVEKNAEIELLLKEIVPYSSFGTEYFQFRIPLLSGRFDISYPKDFVFEQKGYNGFPTVKDTLLNNRRHINVSVSDVPGLRDEPFTFYNVYRMRTEYRVHHFVNENRNDPSMANTWDHFARKLYNNNYKITDKERAAVNNFLTEIGVHARGNELENIKKIENGIKTKIVLYGYVEGEKTDVIDSILLKRAATSDGYIKLFAACFTQAEVLHELGMVADHDDTKLDSRFENWSNLDYHLFYFPNQEKYLSPLSIYYRYPMVPKAALNSKGVFSTIPPKGVVTGGLAEIRTVTPPSAKESQQNMSAGVSFSGEMDAQVDVSYAYTGYASVDLRSELLKQTRDKEKDLVKKVVTFAGKREDIVKYTIANEGVGNYNNNKPLEITATVNAPFLTDRAGKKYLFKIGEMTGVHTALYDEKKRLLPVDLDYPQAITSTISIRIPKGYKVMNPDILKMHADYVDRSLKPLLIFSSNYTLTPDRKNGDLLVVTVSEVYNKTHFPLADYDRFKEVINTAADFNKAVLLIENKGGGGTKPAGKK